MNLEVSIRTRKLDIPSSIQKIGNTWFLDINDQLDRIKTLSEIQKQLASILYTSKYFTCNECGEFEAYCECNEQKTTSIPFKDKNTGIYNYL